VIILNETYLNAGEEFQFGLTGYTSWHQPRDTRDTRGGGVAIYVHANFFSDIIFDDILNEIHFLGINIPEVGLNFATIYRPPVPSNIYPFFDTLDKILEPNRKLILLGDINLDLLRDSDWAAKKKSWADGSSTSANS
jgi:hypothetical protein